MSKREAAVIGGASLFGLGAAFLINKFVRRQAQLPEGSQYTLILEATTGGTTNPAPATFYSETPTTLIVTAIPNVGYTFDGWFIAGSIVSTELTYTVNINGNILLIASFSKIGAPPLIPSYVKPVQNCSSEEWWEAYLEVVNPIGIENWYLRLRQAFHVSGYVKFKISDAAGNGVSNQKIAVYTDPNPDELDFGYVLLNGNEHTSSNPLILTSDADGIVTVLVGYRWIEPNSTYRSTIGQGARAHWTCLGLTGGWIYPIEDNVYKVSPPCSWDNFERVKNPILSNTNFIYAYWIDNPNLPVLGSAAALCMIKIDTVLY